MKYLKVLAGKKAYDHIRKNGLDQSHIDAVFGASGAAKWIAIFGLDTALYSKWFKERKTDLHLFGTSIGAWKFAAALQENPAKAFDRLRLAYSHQRYDGKVTAVKVAKETQRIMDMVVTPEAVRQALSHPVFRIGFSAVQSKGLLAVDSKPAEALAMLSGFVLNLISQKAHEFFAQRVMFHDERYDRSIFKLDTDTTRFIPLTRENFSNAILASASIPAVMKGISQIEGAPKGIYRDGGLLDYHPLFELNDECTGYILYPHFYSHITQGWFDKKLKSRQAKGSILDRIILVAPSDEMVAAMPYSRIPDRKDFVRIKSDDERIKAWDTAAQMSLELGEQFVTAAKTGKIAEIVQPF